MGEFTYANDFLNSSCEIRVGSDLDLGGVDAEAFGDGAERVVHVVQQLVVVLLPRCRDQILRSLNEKPHPRCREQNLLLLSCSCVQACPRHARSDTPVPQVLVMSGHVVQQRVGVLLFSQ